MDDEVRAAQLMHCVVRILTGVQLLGMVPKPVKAVILLFPIDKDSEARKREEDELIEKEGLPKVENTIFFVKQTVCLLIATHSYC